MSIPDSSAAFVSLMVGLTGTVDDGTTNALHDFLMATAHGQANRQAVCAMLAALSARPLSPDLAETMVRAIQDTALTASVLDQDWDAVNIVGTGGGLPSFNISTTAAVLAAAAGVRVLKSGSAAYSSRAGAVDFLNAAGIGMAQSAEQAAEMLDRFCIAFYMPGQFSPLLKRFAMAASPLPLKALAPVLNRIGPLLRLLPASGQLTGLSRRSELGWYADLMTRLGRDNSRLIANPLSLDEACSFVANDLWSGGRGAPWRVVPCDPEELGLNPGFAGAIRGGDAQENLTISRAILSGDGPAVATDCVLLNAALLLADDASDLKPALTEMRRAISSGAAIALFSALGSQDATV